MKKEMIELNIKGLKCDNTSCSYEDQTIPLSDYPEYINSPCPECGENLLTEKDFKSVQFMVKFVGYVNKLLPKRTPKPTDVTMHGKMNGTGKVDFEIDQEK